MTAPIRRRRRRDRGLPTDEHLEALAITYLREQAKHWPTLLASGQLLAATTENARQLRDEFKHLFLADVGLDLEALSRAVAGELKLAMAYLRYSSDNSNERSLDQQLINVLRRAEQEKLFIPWPLVFADAGITGRHVDRQGYQLAKRTIENAPEIVRALICDEVSRTNRYCIEALRLGEIVQTHRRFLLGATDGFDSRNTDSQLILTIFSAIYEWFSTQLGKKVERGMDFAFNVGDVIGRVPTGYKKAVKHDEDGNILLRKNGLPKHVREIDEETAAWVRKAFALFVNEKWAMRRICAHFNRHEACGTRKWTVGQLTKLLKRKLYVGIDERGKTKQVVDRDTGTVKSVKLPRSKWQVKRVPELRLVSDDVFAAAQERLVEGGNAYGNKSDSRNIGKRQDYSPVSLVPLTCGYCGSRLVTARGGKYRSHSCPNGSVHKDGCKLDSCKSDRIINEAIFGFITAYLVTEEVLNDLVEAVNSFLQQQANAPAPDTKGITKEIGALDRKIGRLVDQLEEVEEDRLPEVRQRLAQRRAERETAKSELARLEAAAKPVPPTVTVDLAREVLGDLPKFLQEDVTAVAPVIRQMLGPVKITQEREEGRRGAKWFAEFTFNHVPVLLELTRRRDCPSTDTWEYLWKREWTMPETDSGAAVFRVEVAKTPRYEQLASIVGPLQKQGVSPEIIATKYGVSVHTVYDAIRFYEDRSRPKYKPRRKSDQPWKQTPRPMVYKDIAEEVIRRIDRGENAKQIAEDLGVSQKTVSKAHDHLRPQDMEAAVREGRRVKRQKRYSKFTPELQKQIVDSFLAGQSYGKIASETGVSVSSIGRMIREAYDAADDEKKAQFPERPSLGTYDKVCQLAEEGLSPGEIALEIRRTVSNVHGHLRRWRKSR